MLVLTRKAGESIVIDNRITLVVDSVADQGVMITVDTDCTVIAEGRAFREIQAGRSFPLPFDHSISVASVAVHISSTRKGFARLAFDAPREIKIFRSELLKTAGQ